MTRLLAAAAVAAAVGVWVASHGARAFEHVVDDSSRRSTTAGDASRRCRTCSAPSARYSARGATMHSRVDPRHGRSTGARRPACRPHHAR